MSKLDAIRKSRDLRRERTNWLGSLLAVAIVACAIMLPWFVVRVLPILELTSRDLRYPSDWPLTRQSDYSCGACSLYMLLEDEGVPASIAGVAWYAHTGFNGTTTDGIMDAGQRYGYRVEFRREIGFGGLMASNVPAIVLYSDNGWNHFVYARPDPANGYLVVKNPGRGIIYTRAQDFTNHFQANAVEAVLFYKDSL
jgi:hypothetical protein